MIINALPILVPCLAEVSISRNKKFYTFLFNPIFSPIHFSIPSSIFMSSSVSQGATTYFCWSSSSLLFLPLLDVSLFISFLVRIKWFIEITFLI